MNVDLYICTDEKNKLKKNLVGKTRLVGTIRGDSSIVNPVLMLETNPSNFNYVFIPEFKRYYFINNIDVVRNRLFKVELECDVLMSYQQEILQMSGIVSRLTSGSPYAKRDALTSVKETHKKIEFPKNPFTRDGSYILIAKGDVV